MRTPNVSAPDVIMLRGIDPWWISQNPIRAAPNPTATVQYEGDGQDYFVAEFGCEPFEELCTSTDTMELDWVSVVHAPPVGFSYPSQLEQWAKSGDNFGRLPATSACTSSPCAHGACVDSDTQQAYSEQTAFGFVCNCYPSWTGELCDKESVLAEQQGLSCTDVEDDCDASVSSCAVLGPGQHECICFPGYSNAHSGSPNLNGKGAMAINRCKLDIEDPAVGPSWVSGPGYEAFDGVVIGSFEATVGESPAYLQTSSLVDSSAFFDPAAYDQVLLSTPSRADGCSADAYGPAYAPAVSTEYVMVVSSDGDCPLWLKVILAQRMAAKSVIIYGDGMAGSASSWDISDPSLLSKAVDDTYDVGRTAEELGLACVALRSCILKVH
jgi:hypothetical protein